MKVDLNKEVSIMLYRIIAETNDIQLHNINKEFTEYTESDLEKLNSIHKLLLNFENEHLIEIPF